MLYRVLDCIKLSKLNSHISNCKIVSFLEKKAVKMSTWLESVTYNSGEIPLVNDSAKGINPNTKTILEYSKSLNINWNELELQDSGYRMIRSNEYELFIDIGQIGASYQPGHAHADTFNFELKINNKSYFVDTGVSTYSAGDLRAKERSTRAHNTITVNDRNSSEMWGAFRVGKRASIMNLIECSQSIQAIHDGYKDYGLNHQRRWDWSEYEIEITDKIIGTSSYEGKAYFHLHPEVTVTKFNDTLILNEEIKLIITNAIEINIVDYKHTQEFNVQTEAKCIEVDFLNYLKTTIKIK
jgi:uncharacterized heparinase superfamily protein